ncbi:MAG: TetR/AcrR family transcriptional regulator [Nitriliruptoraceae bacterium]
MSFEGSSGPTSRGQRTRARLTHAARDVFVRDGYVTVRVEDIVAAAGVSHGTFYTYYANKGAALHALIDDTVDALLGVSEESWVGSDVEGTIERVIGRFVDVFATHAPVIRVWLEASAHDHEFFERLQHVRREYVARVASAIRPVLAHTVHDPHDAASALVAMVEGYATHGMVHDDPVRRQVVTRTLASLWFGGLEHLSGDRSAEVGDIATA